MRLVQRFLNARRRPHQHHGSAQARRRRLLVAAHRRGNRRDLLGAQERRAAAFRLRRPRRDGHGLRRRRLRLRGHRRHVARGHQSGARARGGVGARDRALRAVRFAHASAARGPRRLRVAVARRADALAPRMVRSPDERVPAGRHRPAHRRLGDVHRGAHGDASPRHQRRRRRHAALSLPVPGHGGHRARERRHADAHAQRLPRHLPAGRRRDPRALRLRRRGAPDRRGGARADRGAQLSERDDGRAAHARPDDPADPRVDRPPAGARPHPRRRAQFRRHELRHAGHVRHVSVWLRPTQRRVRPDARRGARDLRLGRRGHEGREGAPDPQRHPRAAARRRHLAGARRASGHVEREGRRLEPPADRPDGEPQSRARRRRRSTTWSPASSAA